MRFNKAKTTIRKGQCPSISSFTYTVVNKLVYETGTVKSRTGLRVVP